MERLAEGVRGEIATVEINAGEAVHLQVEQAGHL
jgi:hypothetical protein